MASPAVPAAAADVAIRPVAFGDLDGIETLMGTFDMSDRRLRWFTAAVDVHRAAAWAARPERSSGAGFVAVAGERIVGHAAFAPIDERTAEVCFEVAPDRRREGIAGRLYEALATTARECGIDTLTAEVLPDNADMLDVLRANGARRQVIRAGVIHLELDLGG